MECRVDAESSIEVSSGQWRIKSDELETSKDLIESGPRRSLFEPHQRRDRSGRNQGCGWHADYDRLYGQGVKGIIKVTTRGRERDG